MQLNPPKLKFLLLVKALLLLITISACKKNSLSENPTSIQQNPVTIKTASSTQSRCGETNVDLLAGQFTVAGSIIISNDAENLYVQYQTTGNWVIGQTHLYVGDIALLPKNKSGNPQIGQFPYNTPHSPYVSAYTYTIPLSQLGECFSVAAHAELYLLDGSGNVIRTETGWSKGTQISPKGSWAQYTSYCKQQCCVITPQEFQIFGGQTIPVGALSVTNNEDSLYITFKSSGDWYYKQTHLYVGSLAGLPVNNANTPILGQFPYSAAHNPYVKSYTYAIPLSSLSSCYIIAAHGEAIKVQNGVIVQSETSWSYGTPFPNTNRWGWYSSYCTQTCQ